MDRRCADKKRKKNGVVVSIFINDRDGFFLYIEYIILGLFFFGCPGQESEELALW
jgi:hypothetical protein